MSSFKDTYNEIRNDPENIEFTKVGWNPLFIADTSSRILLIGQSPGLLAQKSELLFNDKSGERLCEWLGVSFEQLHDPKLFAILPMDFYYQGKNKSGDKPPRKSFSKKWHPILLKEMPNIQLTILIGNYAQKYYLSKDMKKNSTETIKEASSYLPKYFPIIHPSPLNGRWLKKNQWFISDTLPILKDLVQTIINKQKTP